MDVVQFVYDASTMVTKGTQVEKSYCVSGPTMILNVDDLTNGFQECQKVLVDCYISLNLEYASNPHSNGVLTYIYTNDLDHVGYHLKGLNSKKRLR